MSVTCATCGEPVDQIDMDTEPIVLSNSPVVERIPGTLSFTLRPCGHTEGYTVRA